MCQDIDDVVQTHGTRTPACPDLLWYSVDSSELRRVWEAVGVAQVLSVARVLDEGSPISGVVEPLKP